MKTKKLTAVLLAVIISMLCGTAGVSAHTVMQKQFFSDSLVPGINRFCVGSDEMGWRIDEEFHTNGTATHYKFSPDFPSTRKSYVRNGAAKWAGIVSIVENDSSPNEIFAFNAPDDFVVAEFRSSYRDPPTGHLSQWTINVNLGKNISATILAHEFGHVIGLTDLYEPQSKSKLMYGYSNLTATAPTASDVWGAKVITGVHGSTHSQKYRIFGSDASGNIHVYECSTCGGFRKQHCVYTLQGRVCTICGFPRSAEINRILLLR